MFLFNFYSNDDLFIIIYLIGLSVSVMLFAASLMFDSKRIFFLFVSATMASIALNINKIPVDIIVVLFIISAIYARKIKGRIRNKVFLNIVSAFIILVLTISGTFSILNFIEHGSDSSHSFFKQEALPKL